MTQDNSTVPAEEIDQEDQPYRTILEVWTSVLAPLPTEQDKPISMQWSLRVVGRYQEVMFADMPDFRDLYFAKAQRLSDILSDVISTDDECLRRVSMEEDAMLNGGLYRQILTAWQKEFLLWEMRWDPTDEYAAIEVAAVSEIHKMFFSPEGLISLLDSIDLQFTDADREALAAELDELLAQRENDE